MVTLSPPLRALPCVLLTLLLPACCCRSRPGGETAAAPAWSDQTRELYHGIPVIVRFTPADPRLEAQVWRYLEGIDDTFNDFREDSEVGKLNRMPERRDVPVSADLAEALRVSQDLHRLTNGAFDVTVGPLRRLWREAEKRGKLPSAAEIAAALTNVDLDKVQLRDGKVTCPQGVKLDFGGVIKGLAVDRAVAMLRSGGARAALVQIGGETAVFGLNPQGRPHRLGIQHPKDLEDIYTAITDPGTGLSASTSGNYRAPLVVEGRELYHIYDPRTGEPVSTRTLSVTVVFRETGRNGLADGLATAGAVLGPARALALIAKLGGEALILEEREGRIVEHKTAGWEKLKAN